MLVLFFVITSLTFFSGLVGAGLGLLLAGFPLGGNSLGMLISGTMMLIIMFFTLMK